MARPKRKRRVCENPKFNIFGPLNYGESNYVFMTLEEYETIRLIDYHKLTQEECAESMEVARTTVQSIYSDARYKIADALISGLTIKIEGGNYKLCQNKEHGEYCFRQRGQDKNRRYRNQREQE